MDEEKDQGKANGLTVFPGGIKPNGQLKKTRRRRQPPQAQSATNSSPRGMGEGRAHASEMTADERRRLNEWSRANPACAEHIYYHESGRRSFRRGLTGAMGEGKLYLTDLTADEKQQLREWRKANPGCAQEIHKQESQGRLVDRVLRGETATEPIGWDDDPERQRQRAEIISILNSATPRPTTNLAGRDFHIHLHLDGWRGDEDDLAGLLKSLGLVQIAPEKSKKRK